MKKQNIKSPLIFVRRGEWEVLRHLLDKGEITRGELLQMPHIKYGGFISRDVIFLLEKKGLIIAKITEGSSLSPTERLLREIFEESVIYALTPAGRAIVKDGLRLAKKFKRMGIDITKPRIEMKKTAVQNGE